MRGLCEKRTTGSGTGVLFVLWDLPRRSLFRHVLVNDSPTSRYRSANTKTMLPEILKLFDLADADGSGEIAIEERSSVLEGSCPRNSIDPYMSRIMRGDA